MNDSPEKEPRGTVASREWRKNNPEKAKATNRRSYLKRKAREEADPALKEAKKAYHADWQKKNRERLRKYKAEWKARKEKAEKQAQKRRLEKKFDLADEE